MSKIDQKAKRTSGQLEDIRLILRDLLKVIKVVAMYPEDNPLPQSLKRTFSERLVDLVSDYGTLDFKGEVWTSNAYWFDPDSSEGWTIKVGTNEYVITGGRIVEKETANGDSLNCVGMTDAQLAFWEAFKKSDNAEEAFECFEKAVTNGDLECSEN